MAELKFPWEHQAMNGEEMPDGLPLEEQLAYQALAHLYGRYHMKLIDRERGSAEKGKIVHALNCRKQKEDMSRRLAEYHTRLIKALEGAANDYAKNRTLEAADRMYQAVYGMWPGDVEVEPYEHPTRHQ